MDKIGILSVFTCLTCPNVTPTLYPSCMLELSSLIDIVKFIKKSDKGLRGHILKLTLIKVCARLDGYYPWNLFQF